MNESDTVFGGMLSQVGPGCSGVGTKRALVGLLLGVDGHGMLSQVVLADGGIAAGWTLVGALLGVPSSDMRFEIRC